MNLQITKCFGLINFEKNPSLTFFFLFEFGTLNDHLGGNTLFCEVKPLCECSKLRKTPHKRFRPIGSLILVMF